MNDRSLAGLIARCHREVDEGLLPSCQLAVAKDGKLVCFETIGAATDANRYLVFSATKGLVASAIWLLLSDDTLRTDQRVAELLPAFGTHGKEVITVEQVLLHTSGFPQAFMNPFDWDDYAKRDETFASWELDWAPGSQYAYHGVSAAWVWCALIEAVSGEHFRTFIQDRIVDPLGLRALRLGVPLTEQGDILDAELRGKAATKEDVMAWGIPELPDDWRQGYQELLLFLNDANVRTVGIPAGGAVSTAADVALFYQRVHANALWDPDALARAVGTCNEMPDDKNVPTTRGLGVQINGTHDMGWWYGFGRGNSSAAYGHDGAGGQIAWVNPETGVSFCYLTNGLDENIMRQKRRMLALGSLAAQLAL